MAVVTVKSGPITLRDSTPSKLANSFVARGDLVEFCGKMAVANGDSIGSKYIAGQLPSKSRLSELKIYSPDIGTTAAADIGLYQTVENGGVVVDADFFASALSLSGGALAGVEVQHESGVYPADNSEMPIWQALGLSVDPGVMYDVVATLTAASDAAGYIVLKGKYAE